VKTGQLPLFINSHGKIHECKSSVATAIPC
jgi:hypothetical protein